MLLGDAEQSGWNQAAAAGLLTPCPITELEFFRSARSAAHPSGRTAAAATAKFTAADRR